MTDRNACGKAHSLPSPSHPPSPYLHLLVSTFMAPSLIWLKLTSHLTPTKSRNPRSSSTKKRKHNSKLIHINQQFIGKSKSISISKIRKRYKPLSEPKTQILIHQQKKIETAIHHQNNEPYIYIYVYMYVFALPSFWFCFSSVFFFPFF